MKTRYDLRWLLAVLSLASIACAASRPPETAKAADSAPAVKWEDLDDARLRAYLTEQATVALAKAQPELDPTRLDAYCKSPESAPAIKGKAIDRLFDLVTVALSEGRLDEAERLIRLVRARAANRNSAYAGTTMLAEIARERAGEDPEAQVAAIAAVLRELPRERLAPATVVFRILQNQEQLQGQLAQAKAQMVSLETAGTALVLSQIFPRIVASRERFLAALARVEGESAPAKADYRFATVDLTGAKDVSPVVIGVWDTGVQAPLFEKQLFLNPREQPNGRDDDGNGQIDDLSGIVADGDAPHTATLYQPAPEIVEKYGPYLQGIMDLQVGMATTEAAQKVIEYMKGVQTKEALEEQERGFAAITEWSHGTHVAGLALAGNPFARLAIFRSAWAGESRPYLHRGPTDEELEAERKNMLAVADFIRRHEVRVVNASLGFTQDWLESELGYEKERYQSVEQIKARAEQIQAKRRANWREVFEACPQTLFVVSAGNSNQDVLEYGHTPSDIGLPNVLAVGAVDRWGNWATFTNSNPERVKVFDFGVSVESYIPDGKRVPLSGTSMASPNVANLAGKILTVAPGLKPEEVSRLIIETGDPIAAPFDGVIANEERAIEGARQMRAQASNGR